MANKPMEEYRAGGRPGGLIGLLVLGLVLVAILLGFLFTPDVIDPLAYTGQVEGRVLVVKNQGSRVETVVKLADGSYFSAPTGRFKKGENITISIYTRRFSRRQVLKVPE